MADEDDITFDELKDALMPPGTDKDALWAALKGSRVEGPAKAEFLGKIRTFHQTGGHVPGGFVPDVSFGRSGMGTTCAVCASIGVFSVHTPGGDECRMVQAAAQHNALPPPAENAPMVQASIAANEVYRSLLAGGFSTDEATTIIAKMIAFHQGQADG